MLRLTDETARPVKNGDKRRELKSGRSRSFPIHPDLQAILQRMPHVDSYIFHGPRGGRIKPDTVRRMLVNDVIRPLAKGFRRGMTKRGLRTADCTVSAIIFVRPAK